VREVDVNLSDWDCTLESLPPSPHRASGRTPVSRRAMGRGGGGEGQPSSGAPARRETSVLPNALWRHLLPKGEGIHPRHAEMSPHIRTTHAVRLGFRQIIGVREKDMLELTKQRGEAYDSVRDLWLRSGLSSTVLERLADADAFRSLGLDRRQALWAVRGLDRVGDQDDLPLFSSRPGRDTEPDARLPPMPLGAHVVEDYRRLSLSLKAHPASFLRARLSARGILRSEALSSVKNGERVTVAGLVLVRQRPGTAGGVIFMTLEDETGVANIIVWPKVFERLRAIVLGARFVAVTGKLQSEQGVIHIVAERMNDLTPMLGLLSEAGPTIGALARADEAHRTEPTETRKRQGSRFAGPPRLDDPRAKPPSPPMETVDIAEAMPAGRNFR
jgi:error-prone DNA polymerase